MKVRKISDTLNASKQQAKPKNKQTIQQNNKVKDMPSFMSSQALKASILFKGHDFKKVTQDDFNSPKIPIINREFDKEVPYVQEYSLGMRAYSPKGKLIASTVNIDKDFNVEFISGKFGEISAVLKPKDEKYKGLSILLRQGAKAKALNSKKTIVPVIDMNPSQPVFFKGKSNVSFNGKFFASIGEAAYPEKMANAYSEFFDKGIQERIIKTDKTQININKAELKDDYNFYVPTDGLGTRLGDATYASGGISKPAIPLPAKIGEHNYRLIHNTLSTFTKTGKLDGGYGLIKVKGGGGSAQAFLQGLGDGTIPTDKPLVLTWGDAFSDLDLTKVLKEHEENNAGLTVVGIPVDDKHIKGFAAVGIDNDGSITKLIEKPKTLEAAEFSKIEGTENYRGSVGPYVFSKPVLEHIKREYNKNPESLKNQKGEFDLSSRILTPMVELLSKNQIKGAGPMKPYITNCNWSDVGTTSEYMEQMRNAAEGKINLPEDVAKGFKKNVDLETGTIFTNNSKELFNQFCEETGYKFSGDVLVTIAE